MACKNCEVLFNMLRGSSAQARHPALLRVCKCINLAVAHAELDEMIAARDAVTAERDAAHRELIAIQHILEMEYAKLQHVMAETGTSPAEIARTRDAICVALSNINLDN